MTDAPSFTRDDVIMFDPKERHGQIRFAVRPRPSRLALLWSDIRVNERCGGGYGVKSGTVRRHVTDALFPSAVVVLPEAQVARCENDSPVHATVYQPKMDVLA